MSNTTCAIDTASVADPARALRWLGRVAWLGIVANVALGAAVMSRPEAIMRLLALQPATPRVWPRFAALMLILLSIFYVPGAVDPAGQRFAAVFAVVCRFAGVAFFGAVGGAYVLFGLYDLAFALPQAILLWSARPLLRAGA